MNAKTLNDKLRRDSKPPRERAWRDFCAEIGLDICDLDWLAEELGYTSYEDIAHFKNPFIYETYFSDDSDTLFEKTLRMMDLQPDVEVADMNKVLKKSRKLLTKYDLQWLIDDLESGIVFFAYMKKNGELRYAKGTRLLSKIPKDAHPINGKAVTAADKVVRYYDMVRNAWRSFRKTNKRGKFFRKNV
jgi:hypothetical protein